MADKVAGRSVDELITGGWISQVVRALAELRIADQLADRPLSLEDLAAASGTHQKSLGRLMRAAVGLGLCDCSPDGEFSLTRSGDALRSDVPGSARAFALMAEAPYQRRAWEGLADAVRSGEPVFERAHGQAFWAYLAEHPYDQANFDQTMAAGTTHRAEAVVEVCDFSGVRTVVDVGGGNGAMLAAVLHAVPDVAGIVFDRPDAVRGAETVITDAGLTDRCRAAGGDFFTTVPTEGDAYLLAQILHDWPDGDAAAILRACSRAMRTGARLWVIERIMPVGEEPPLGYSLLDLSMLVHFGASERTLDEFAGIFEGTGLTAPVPHESTSGWTVLESVRE